jgi:CrcB protein
MSRYGVTLAAQQWEGFPWGTFMVNVLGSILLGAVLEGALRGTISPEVRLAVGTGFLGAFTTFSTFSVETVRLIEAGRYLAAAGNAGGNLTLGLVGAGLGIALARALF